MNSIKTKGIIIAENNYQDFDKMLTMLTPGLGKISCIAKGSRRMNSKLLAGTQLFSFCEFVLYKTKDVYHINQVETIDVFYDLRTNLDKLTKALEINKIVFNNTFEEQNSYKILNLYVATLYTLTKENSDLDLIDSIFKLRLTKELGYMPNLYSCMECNGENINDFLFFSIEKNGIICKNCGKKDVFKINSSIYNAIKYTIEAPIKKLYSFNLIGDSKKEFIKIANKYFKYILNVK